MQFFIAAYALAFLLWVSDGRHPWLLLTAILAVSVWLVLYLRWRNRHNRHLP